MPANPRERDQFRQLTHTMRKYVTYSDASIDAGTLRMPAALPAGSIITQVIVDVVTAFNAGTTNVLTVGTQSGTANDIVTAGDVNEGAAGVNNVTTSAAIGYIGSSAIDLFIKYAQTGTAATAGAAHIVVCYIPDNDG